MSGSPRRRLSLDRQRSTSSQSWPQECPFSEVGCNVVLYSSTDYQTHLSTNTEKHLQLIDDLHKEAISGELGTSSRSSSSSPSITEEIKQDNPVGQEDSLSADKLKAIESEVEFLTDVLSGYGISQLPALECIKTQLKMPEVAIATLGDSCTFRMVNMSHHSETGEKWLSPKFMVRGGHKMRLAVYPRGIGSGEGSHLSLKLLLLFDDQLEWPLSLPSHLGIRVELLIESEGLFEDEDSFDFDPMTATRAPSSSFNHNLECTWKPRGERKGSPRGERKHSPKGERKHSPKGERRNNSKGDRSSPVGDRSSPTTWNRRNSTRGRFSSRGERDSSSTPSPTPPSPLTKNTHVFDRTYSFNRKIAAPSLVRRSSFNEKSSVKSVSLEESRKRMARILPPWLQPAKESQVPTISEKKNETDSSEKLTNGATEKDPPTVRNLSSPSDSSRTPSPRTHESRKVENLTQKQSKVDKELSKSPSFDKSRDGFDGATVFCMERFATFEQIEKYTQEYNSLVFQITLCLV